MDFIDLIKTKAIFQFGFNSLFLPLKAKSK